MATATKYRTWTNLACTWHTSPRKTTPRKNKALPHIIDREADSVYHLREWDAARHPFLVRMRGYSGVTRNGKTYKAQELEREPNYSFYKNVHYQGKQVAETEVVLTRESNAKRAKGGIPR